MIDEDIEAFISAIENHTRREILRSLILDQSYALQISRWIGVSQQAIIKQLDLLEKANLISSVGLFPSTSGASRKIYRPTGFSTLVADYSKNFIEVRRYELPSDSAEKPVDQFLDHRKLTRRLEETNRKLSDIMSARMKLIIEKDTILGELHSYINNISPDDFTKNILYDYSDTMDPQYVSKKYSVPVSFVMQLAENYLK
ncbi:MAG: ArsR family transcriptional regulator [Candidatus Thermoplasmatota archaeon]|nr:ArsR family transcriptional regulator [Candidatus Thermoplasmatota archaeon]